MIKGIGIDIVEIHRIADIISRKPAFVRRILTDQELVQCRRLLQDAQDMQSFRDDKMFCRRQHEYVAGRFAAKEAFAKALGTGIGAHCSWHDVCITNKPGGGPEVVWHRSPRDENMHIHLSISHSQDYAVAQIVLEQI